LLAFGLSVAGVLFAGAAWLLMRYRRTFEEATLSGVENTKEGVQAIVAKGESRKVEFKSTMRMNLHAGKPGREIELAWLKGVAAFMNTDGGTLLLGVTDAGEITGIEQDLFENEDKCRLHFKNLIARHIGAELSKYIRFVLVPVDGVTVGVVHCARSAEPVFLRDGDREHFYIRNGPSSDELPVSKALKYIENRN
jgi:predicted HTH transcriptional regulator